MRANITCPKQLTRHFIYINQQVQMPFLIKDFLTNNDQFITKSSLICLVALEIAQTENMKASESFYYA